MTSFSTEINKFFGKFNAGKPPRSVLVPENIATSSHQYSADVNKFNDSLFCAEKDSSTNEGNQNIYFTPKKEEFDIITIDSDESDCDTCCEPTESENVSYVTSVQEVIDNAPQSSERSSMPHKVVNNTPQCNERVSQVHMLSRNSEDSNNLLVPSSVDDNDDENSKLCTPKMTIREYYSSNDHHEPDSLYQRLSENKWSCVCNVICTSLWALRKHTHFHCPQQRKYNVACKICGSTCASPEGLRGHFIVVHGINGSEELRSLTEQSFIVRVQAAQSEITSRIVRSADCDKREDARTYQSPQSQNLNPCTKTVPARGLMAVSRTKRFLHCKSKASNGLSGPSIVDSVREKNFNVCKDRISLNEFFSLKYKQIRSQMSFRKISLNKWSCTFCGKIARYLGSLRRHALFHCPAQQMYKIRCKICDYPVGNTSALRRHIAKTHGIKNKQKLKSIVRESAIFPVENSESGTKFRVREQKSPACREHQSLEETPSPGWVSNNSRTLNLSTGTESNQNVVKSKNSESPYCQYCKKTFSSGLCLRSHRDFSCPFQKKYLIYCKICGKPGSRADSMYHHLIRFHGMKNSFEARNFVVKIKTESKLKVSSPVLESKNGDSNHRDIANSEKKRTNESKFTKKLNNSVIYTENEFTSLKSTINQFQCNHCFATFREKIFLETHNRYKHRCISSKDPSIKERKYFNHSANPKMYFMCEVCRMNFFHCSKLEQHLNEHEYISIKCEFCENSFQKFTLFKNHLRILGHVLRCGTAENDDHESSTYSSVRNTSDTTKSDQTQDNPLTCNVCEKEFVSVLVLMKHLEEHLLCDYFEET